MVPNNAMELIIMRKLPLLLLLLIVSQSAIADWTLITTNESGSYSAYIDFSSIQKSRNLVRLNTLFDFREPQSWVTDFSFKSSISTFEFDCNSGQQRTASIDMFNGSMGQGGLAASIDHGGKWGQQQNDSVGKYLWKIACRQLDQ